jgi:GntR family transcriptional regulator/MocR family aminotransferase
MPPGWRASPCRSTTRACRWRACTMRRAAARAVFLTPSHQFPTGATLALDRRLAVIEWARQNQAWIIEDDYDSEFHYAGKPTACVQGLDPYDRTIYIGTFTKSLFPGLRIGYVVLAAPARGAHDGGAHLAGRAQRIHPAADAGTLHRRGAFRRLCARDARRLCRPARRAGRPRARASGRLRRTEGAGIGGMQMPCVFTRDISERAVIDAAARAGIDLLGLTALHASTRHRAGFLMGFAAYTPAELETAVERLARVLRERERR